MDPLFLFNAILVISGALVMAVAIRTGIRVNKSVPGEFSNRWKILTNLMIFFLLGYCAFLVLLISKTKDFLEAITAVVFFGGALYVYLVINLTRQTINELVSSKAEITTPNKNLRLKTQDLEIEVEKQVETEKALNSAKTALENIFQSSIPICITGLDFEIIRANDAYNSVFDRPENPMGRFMCYDSRPGPTCHTENCIIRLISAGKKKVVQECSKVNENGMEQFFIVTAKPMYDPEGNLQGIVESFQDITLRKKAENSLAKEKELLAITLQSIGDGVITTDLEGRVLTVNRVAERLCGWTSEEAVGHSLEKVFHLVDFTTRKKLENPVTRVLKSEKPVELTPGAVLIAKDGWERFIADSAAPIIDHEKNMFGVVLVFRDISEKRQMESEITKLEKIKSIGLLAGGIAHDFNNLLTAILGNISLAKVVAEPDSTVAGKLAKAETAVMRAKGLTDQLLTFSKGGEPVKKVISIDKLLKESVNFALRGSNTRYQFAINPDLWSIVADSEQISQVINNLIINANQSMPSGGTIHILAENHVLDEESESLSLLPGKYVQIQIIDEGEGIPREQLPRIFDPYFSTKTTGSGIGLSTVYSVINRHGGYITVDSEPGIGTTFTFFLPASTEEPEVVEEESDELHTGSGTVLIMDDDKPILDVAGMMLTELGYTPLYAENGKEAIRVYTEALEGGEPIGCVILDLTIPGGMGGKETIEHLLEIDPNVRAIVSSGYSSDPILANYSEYGFTSVVGNPYNISELSRVLEKVLSPSTGSL